MKTAIYTLQVKLRDDIYEECFSSIKRYAELCNSDLIVRNAILDHKLDNEQDYKNIIMEKFYIKELLSYYDRVLYLDADVLIKNDAPDIFKFYYDVNSVYLYNEIKHNGVEYDRQIEEIQKKLDIEWPKSDGHYDFYNAGVMLVNKAQKRLFTFNKDKYFIFDDLPMIVDEPILNYNLFKFRIPIEEMTKQYNTMVYFEDDGWFLHFANVLDRKERIKKYL